MRMSGLDWSIVTVCLALLVWAAWLTKKYTRSVADFLSGNRCAGRYLLGIAEGISGAGAITYIAYFEMYYKAGFALTWWVILGWPVAMVVSLSGWVIYRYRQTRAMTMAQLFEMRYSRNFRLFCGILGFVSGVINFAIAPAVGARFFVYFCGLPETVWGVPTFALVMIVLLGISLFFAFVGGQIAVMLTDFLQGLFSNIFFSVICIVFLWQFPWSHISEALATAPPGHSMLNPFDTSQVRDFNMWFYLIMFFGMVYGCQAFQGAQGYNCAAKNAHEAKMSKILGNWRGVAQALLIILLPVIAYTFLHHESYSSAAEPIKADIQNVPLEFGVVREQMTVPVVLSHILPKGLMGAFCALMLFGFISVSDTYLHSWGSIFIQDVVLPFRKTPFTHDQHIKLLKFSMVGVAVFIFLFSLFFKQTQNIMMWFAITGAMYIGGAGSVIIGGLYWKRGSNMAAWCAMITGSVLSVTGIVVHLISPGFFISGMWMSFIAMVSSLTVYFIVSICGNTYFNMDKLLHRGKYAVQEDRVRLSDKPSKLAAIGITKEFTRGDKCIYFSVILWMGSWFVAFVVITLYHFFIQPLSVAFWSKFWKIKTWIYLFVGMMTTVWFSIGGFRNLVEMVRILKTDIRDFTDDGFVRERIENEKK